MAIQSLPQSIPSELPPAKLYLDDITEILQILTDSNPGCQASFVAGKSKCDTLDDLRDLGGRTTHFVMNISSPGKHQTLELTPSSTRIHIHEIGDPLPAWSKYVNVAAIFEKRRLRLKSVSRAIGWRLFAGLWLLTLALWMFVPHALKPVLSSEAASSRDRDNCGCCDRLLLRQFTKHRVFAPSPQGRGGTMAGRAQTRNYCGPNLCPDQEPLPAKLLERFWK